LVRFLIMTLQKKIIYFTTIFILFSNNFTAQNPNVVDSLKKEISLHKNVNEQIEIYNQIAWNMKNSNLDSSLFYAYKAKEMAENEGYKAGLAEALKNIGNIHSKRGQNILAISNYEKAYQLFVQINDTIGKASSLNNLGNVASSRADFFKAVDYYLNAIKLYKLKSDSLGICGCYLNIGTVYNRMQKYDKALVYTQLAADISAKLPKKTNLSTSYLNIGAIYSNLSDYEKSVLYFKKALALKISLNEQIAVANIYSNIGRIFMEINNTDSALFYLNKSLEIKQQQPNYNDYAPIYIAFAELFTKKGNYPKALMYLKNAEKYIVTNKSDYLMPLLLKTYSEVYLKKNDYKMANFYLVKQQQYSDSLSESKVELRIADLEKQYEIEKRELQISSLKKEKELNNLQMEKSKQIIWLWVVISVLFIGIAIFSQFAIRNNKRKNKMLEQQNNEILMQHDIIANQKERIKKELSETIFKSEILERENLQYKLEALKNQLNPHFLFNTFSTLISLISEDQVLAKEYAHRLSNMYRYILTRHDVELATIQEELEFVEAYIFMVAIRFDNLVKLHNRVNTNLKLFHIPSFSLQLLVENAVKHNVISNKHPLNIYIENSDTQIIVRNDFKSKKTSETSTGIGLNNIKDRYKLISNQAVEIISNENEFIVKIPIVF